MSIRATSAGGAQVEFSSCHDDEFPPSNCISPDTSEFWMLTGMFPHEIVIRLPASATVRQVQISSMNLGSVKVSRASGPAPGSWNELCSFDMSPTPGVMQSESADCDAGEATFVRFQFLSGVAAFAAVYSLAVIS